MTQRRSFLLSPLLLVLPAMFLTGSGLGCAAAPADSSAASESEVQTSPEYDAVVAAPDQLVSGPNAPTPRWPTYRRSIGFYRRPPDEVGRRLLAFAEWTAVEADGAPVFSSASVTQDLTEASVRTIAVTLVVKAEGDPKVDLLVTVAKNDAGDTVVHAENPTPVFAKKYGLVIRAVEPGSFQIDAVIAAYPEGTIVDASIKAKTPSTFVDGLADKALAPILPALIRWSRAGLYAPR